MVPQLEWRQVASYSSGTFTITSTINTSTTFSTTITVNNINTIMTNTNTNTIHSMIDFYRLISMAELKLT